MQQQLEQAHAKIIGMEKAKHRMQQELEDAQLQTERALQMVTQLEKKQKGVDRLIEDWHTKCEALGAELEASQRETRMASTEVNLYTEIIIFCKSLFSDVPFAFSSG